MSDPVIDAPDDVPQEGDDTFNPERAKAKITKANQEAAALRKRLKDAEAKAARLDQLEESQKSEQQKLAEQLRAQEERAAKAEADAARLRVAMEKGLTPAQAKRLVGSTDEELEADADELLASFAPPEPGDKPPAAPRRPAENLRSGGDPTQTTPEDNDPLLAALRGAVGLAG